MPMVMKPISEPRFSRRQMLELGAAGLALTVPGLGALAAPQPGGFFARHKLPIGLQLYTVGDSARADIAGTLSKVAAAGFTAVELAGFHGHDARTLRQAADAAGISFPSIHMQAKAQGSEPGLDQDPDKIAADMKVLGVTDVVLPMFLFPENLPKPQPGDRNFFARAVASLTRADWQATAAFLNRKAADLKKVGLRLSYHNHNPEFRPIDGTTGLAILLAETDPELVSFEMDVGWVAAAGVDPVPLLKAQPHRFRMMHVKDIKADTQANFALQQDPTEVGSGELKWPMLLDVAWASGVRRFFVEQEPPFARDRFEAIAISAKYLAAVA